MLECDIVSVAFGLLLPSLVSLANAHPQCLDFLPPFEGASGYCTASSEQEKDKKVRQYCTYDLRIPIHLFASFLRGSNAIPNADVRSNTLDDVLTR